MFMVCLPRTDETEYEYSGSEEEEEDPPEQEGEPRYDVVVTLFFFCRCLYLL